MIEGSHNVKPLMKLHMMANNIESMRDHVTSMSEHVIYCKTGERPANRHLFSDKTSSDPKFMKLEYLK